MIIESTLTKAKYMKFSAISYLRHWVFYFVIVVFLAICVGEFVTNGNFLFPILYLFFMLVLFAFFILRGGFSSKNRNIFLPRKFIFEEEIISVDTPIGEESLKWEVFISWKKIAGCYYLVVTKDTGVIIPQSAIPTQDIASFESLLRRKIKK